MENSKIAEIFYEIADILEISGENVFRIRSYRKAAQIVESFPKAMHDLAKIGVDELQKIKGIGKDLANKIVEISETGKCKMHQDLLKTFPPDLLKMLRIRGLGPKKVKLFMLELGIDTIDKLKKAAEAGELQKLDGMGAKSEAEILKAIGEMEKFSGRMLVHEALVTAESFIDYLKKSKAVKKVEYAGSLRRRKETVGDLDLLAIAQSDDQQGDIFDYFVKYPEIDSVIARGDTKCSVLLDSGVQVDLRVVAEESFGAAMHYFTGSKQHNIAVRGRAQKMGMKVNEYGVFRTEKSDANKHLETKSNHPTHGEMVAGESEEELFAALGLSYIEPEMRTSSGEIEAAAKNFEGSKSYKKGGLPKLIETKDLKGDLHMHSTWSDASASIKEMAGAWKKAGYDYLAMTDHSPSLQVANGLSVERLKAKNKEIDELNKELKDFRVLKGTECDILADGEMDYSDEVLAELDVVVASVHNNFKLSAEKQTERIIKAIRNPHVKIIGHLHGRLLGRREGYQINTEEIFKAAKEEDVAIEINSQPLRLDIWDAHCRLAKEMGVKLAINTDSHNPEQVDFLKFGIGMARRGWIEKGDVVNCMGVEELLEWLGGGR